MDDLYTSLKMASSGSFYQLPNELLLKIFAYLDIHELVLNVQHVDSHWRAIVQDISFWRDYVFTFDKQMADKEIILLLENMPALRALVATRGASNQLIHTLCKTNRFITHLELHHNHKFSTFYLETIVKNLPQIQYLAFPLLPKESGNAMKYSALIQQLPELLSLKLLGYGFKARNCFFLKGIAIECPLLQEIDLGVLQFYVEDIVSFLELKKKRISKFFAEGINSSEIICFLNACKELQALHFAHCGESLQNMSLLDLPNLKHLGITQYDQDDFSIIEPKLKKTTMYNLLKLDLSSCNLGAVQFKNILVKCVHLKILILQCCSLPTGDDFQHIGKCTHLEYVDLQDTNITDVAVQVFAEKCRKLKHLDMIDAPAITDLAFQYLMKCNELRCLKLNGTQITGQNFHLIPLHLNKLCELHVEYCDQLNSQCIHQLQEQMIHLKVHADEEVTVTEDSVDLAGANLFTELC